MKLQKYQYHFFIIPAVSLLLAIGALLVWGLQIGIDLKGGTLLQVSYSEQRPELDPLQTEVNKLDMGEFRIQPVNEKEYILRFKDVTPEEKKQVDEVLQSFGAFEEVQYNSVGPSIGSELMHKSWWAMGMIVLLTISFIAFAFRHVSEPVASWKYGVVAMLTLVHDIVISTGLFAYLGHVRGAEVGALFIVALLTILGISINDTIVVFDRIRENLSANMLKHKVEPFADVVWHSTMQTLTRSLNTSLTVIIVLLALFFIGPVATKDFALTLTIGMVAGTYSSILLASPMLILIAKYQKVASPTDTKKS